MPDFKLVIEPYTQQVTHWPKQGKYILAHFDNEHIVVYQAYNREIGEFAAENGYFLGAEGFKLERMTWIKPSFLWMMDLLLPWQRVYTVYDAHTAERIGVSDHNATR